MQINETLKERGKRYGEFKDHAKITQSLKHCCNSFMRENNKSLSESHKEALEMILHKIGRILNGDPNYRDNWHDIAGYATLAEEECHLEPTVQEQTWSSLNHE